MRIKTTNHEPPKTITKPTNGKTFRSESVILNSAGKEIENISVVPGENVFGFPVQDVAEKKRILIAAQITSVARLYGATGQIDPHTMAESVSFILDNYSDFSIDEIKFAFEFSATDVNGNIALYGKPYNLEWFSRSLRFWKTRKAELTKEMIVRKYAEAEKLEATEARRREERNKANIETIRRIADEYERFLFSAEFSFRVFWFQFLERIEYFSVTPASKNRAMARAKTETIRKLEDQIEAVEKRGHTFSVSKIAKTVGHTSGGDMQKTEAVRRIMTAHFRRLRRKGVDAGEFERKLISLYNEKVDELTEPKYRVVVDMKIGKKHIVESLSKDDAVQLKAQHERENASRINGVKIEIQ